MGEGKLVIIADDRSDMLDLLRFRLETGGYQVDEATGGTSALELLSQRKDEDFVLVTDFQMPDMDGVVLVRKAMASKLISPAQVVVHTADPWAPELQDLQRDHPEIKIVRKFNPELETLVENAFQALE